MWTADQTRKINVTAHCLNEWNGRAGGGAQEIQTEGVWAFCVCELFIGEVKTKRNLPYQHKIQRAEALLPVDNSRCPRAWLNLRLTPAEATHWEIDIRRLPKHELAYGKAAVEAVPQSEYAILVPDKRPLKFRQR